MPNVYESRKMINQNSVLKIISISAFLFSFSASGDESKYSYVGTGSCSSSNCHGSVNPRKATNVLQNEYYTWSKYDRHAKAYAILLEADAKKIAHNLGTSSPEKDPLCLRCHATYVADEKMKGEKYRIEDGVTCESCHGAGSGWLSSHAISGATHKKNVENGLKDLDSLSARAGTCLECHYGSDNQTVNHKLYGAGHPRLSFELDTFQATEPRHWDIDKDYIDRKGAYLPAKAWLVGQIMQASEVLKALGSVRAVNGKLPELSMFDCSSCHHSLTEDQWKSRSYGGNPGELKLNAPSLVILREAFLAIDPDLGAEIREKLAAIHARYVIDGAVETITTLKSLLLSDALQKANAGSYDQASLSKILKRFSGFCAQTPWLTYETAEQIAMGVEAISSSYPELKARNKHAVQGMLGGLANSEAFDPRKFVGACKGL